MLSLLPTKLKKLPWDWSSQDILTTKLLLWLLKSVRLMKSMPLKEFFHTNLKSIWLMETKSLSTNKLSTKKLKSKNSPLMMFSVSKLWFHQVKESQRKLMSDVLFSRELWIKFTTLKSSKADNFIMKFWINIHHFVSVWMPSKMNLALN